MFEWSNRLNSEGLWLRDLISVFCLCRCQWAYLTLVRAVVEWCIALGAQSRKWPSVKFPNRSLNYRRGAYVCMHALRESCCFVLLWHHRKAFKDGATPLISFPPPFPVSSPLCFQQFVFSLKAGTSPLKLGENRERKKNSRNDFWRGRKMGGRVRAMFRAASSWSYPCQPDTVPFAHRVINPACWLL